MAFIFDDLHGWDLDLDRHVCECKAHRRRRKAKPTAVQVIAHLHSASAIRRELGVFLESRADAWRRGDGMHRQYNSPRYHFRLLFEVPDGWAKLAALYARHRDELEKWHGRKGEIQVRHRRESDQLFVELRPYAVAEWESYRPD